ncbi:hypothetical protein C0J52_01333 [Blattella germanica]|nr:hypothetical protein C0J52_01333 [Blattella germanica]
MEYSSFESLPLGHDAISSASFGCVVLHESKKGNNVASNFTLHSPTTLPPDNKQRTSCTTLLSSPEFQHNYPTLIVKAIINEDKKRRFPDLQQRRYWSVQNASTHYGKLQRMEDITKLPFSKKVSSDKPEEKRPPDILSRASVVRHKIALSSGKYRLRERTIEAAEIKFLRYVALTDHMRTGHGGPPWISDQLNARATSETTRTYRQRHHSHPHSYQQGEYDEDDHDGQMMSGDRLGLKTMHGTSVRNRKATEYFISHGPRGSSVALKVTTVKSQSLFSFENNQKSFASGGAVLTCVQ